MTLKRLLIVFVCMATLALAAGACGGDDSNVAEPDGSSDSTDSADTEKSGDTAPGQAGQAASSTRHKVVADLGFRPATDGFGFENFGNEYPSTPGTLTMAELRKMFGDAAVCAGGSNSSKCTPAPGAVQFLDQLNKSSNGGHCEGFSVESLRLYLRYDAATAFGEATTSALKVQGNDALKRQIAYYMASQFVDPSSSAAAVYRTMTPKKVLSELVSNMKDGKDPMTIGIYARQGGGHAMTPYAVEDTGNGIFWIMVYDNNWPGVERHIEIDTKKDTWLYDLAATKPGEPAEPWEGDATTFSLDLTPLSARDGQFVCPWCGQKSLAGSSRSSAKQSKEVIFRGAGNLTVTDKSGRSLTYVNGRLTANNIPGATVTSQRFFTDPEKQVPNVVIFLPGGADYSIAMTGKGIDPKLLQAQKESIAVFGQGDAIIVDNFDLSENETDVLNVSADGNKNSFKFDGSERPVIRIAHDSEDGADYLYEVEDIDVDAGEQLNFGVDEASGKFTLKQDGGKASDYDLTVDRIDADGEHEFTAKDQDLNPGESDVVDVAKWDGAHGSIPIAEDTDGDGQPDSTSEVADEAP